MPRRSSRQLPAGKHRRPISKKERQRLERLLGEALMDAYGEGEERVGVFTMIEDNLEMPFKTRILGVEVTVERVDMNDGDEIVAVCRSDKERQRIPVLDLPLPSPPPKGAEWISVYRLWMQRL